MSVPPAIPDHTLLRPIGRGAYGEVWLARNIMGALRAVKVVERRQFDSDRPYQREFSGIQRYEPVSRSADGLVHVLHVGSHEAEGYFYYVMELADAAGGSSVISESVISKTVPVSPSDTDSLITDPLMTDYSPRTLRSDLKRLGSLPIGQCLRLALDVVGGLARLHDNGLVHRDVKPGNIIFVEGRAKLADIGLVSRGGEGRTFVGTEGYIPPEGPGSDSADLYALGLVLYEAATGYPPDRFPKVPAEWFAEDRGTEPLEFHEIVLKACEGAKECRYQSAEEMQADLALLQSGQSVRHLRALEKRIRRWRRVGWAAGVSVALAATTALVANWRARVEADGRAEATRLLQRAEIAEHETQRQLYTALLEQARATVRSGEVGQRVQALDAVRRAAAISNSVELRREVFAALALPDLRFERELVPGTEFTVRQLDPKFERIALGRGRGPVEIRSLASERLLSTLPASTNLPAHNARWSADGRFLSIKRDHSTTGSTSDLEVWEVSTSRMVLLVRNLVGNAYSFHPRKPHLLTGTTDGWVTAWDLIGGREQARSKTEASLASLAYSPDGDRVAALYPRADGWSVSVLQAMDSTLLASASFRDRVYSLDWHPGGDWIAVADVTGNVRRMDAHRGETHLIGQHKAEAATLAFSPDGEYLISGGWERELICWDVAGMRRAFTIGLDSFQLQFRADGGQCAVMKASGIQLHAFERSRVHREFTEELGTRLRHATVSPDGRWLAASAGNGAGIWDLVQGGPAALATEAFDARFHFTPDAQELFGSRSGNPGKDCFRWRISPATHSGSPPRIERLPLPKPPGFTFLSLCSNSIVMTATRGSQVLSREEIEAGADRWKKTERGISGGSPDGKWLAIYQPFDTLLHLYSMPGLEPIVQLSHPARITDFEFSPPGDELAIFSSRAGIEFWSTATWERTRALTNFTRILYTPDARVAWLQKDLRTAGLFNARTLEPFLMLPTGMLPLALSPDGSRVVVSVNARRLQMWDLTALRAELAKLGLDWN